ncbi:MAG: alpha/beta fold hydrolase [Actinobacteria bacterium]|nr:alpha/beta fold hydrolase [Actinomycetota bacterium]NBQ66547.1 alpha/beta fold hydrolase [Actinomycetota bacterium]NCU82404.1 alpha/beta fold hydrolase [Actinomycetota bacterium]NCU83929.1 alpha/beta fold hydrolase [Actinomycetota bacterium]NCY11095.1 alpha/beta fold hydrolase [Actinomycetota bacterium]
MAELIRPSTVLPAERSAITFFTSDGLKLIGEIARPIEDQRGIGLLCLHPLPTHGGMMDSHIYKKAANRLPELAGINVIRFNTRGTKSDQGVSEGHFGEAITEKEDVVAAINYSLEQLGMKELWVSGWSFGSDLALKYARDKRVRGLILLSPPLRFSTEDDLAFWREDGRSITALIPEFDDYLKPDQAKQRFSQIPQIELIDIKDGKHLWVGEPFVHRVLSEIVRVVAPERLPLPLEI